MNQLVHRRGELRKAYMADLLFVDPRTQGALATAADKVAEFAWPTSLLFTSPPVDGWT